MSEIWGAKMNQESNNKSALRALIFLIEKIVSVRSLSRWHHRDEVEKFLNFAIQGSDMINPYERRNAGVTDDEWNRAVRDFNLSFSLVRQQNKKEGGESSDE